MPYLSCKVQKIFFYSLIISLYSFSKITCNNNEEMISVNIELMPIDDEFSKTEKPESSCESQMLLEKVINYSRWIQNLY